MPCENAYAPGDEYVGVGGSCPGRNQAECTSSEVVAYDMPWSYFCKWVTPAPAAAPAPTPKPSPSCQNAYAPGDEYVGVGGSCPGRNYDQCTSSEVVAYDMPWSYFCKWVGTPPAAAAPAPVDCVGEYEKLKPCPSDCGLSASTITQRYIVTTPAKHNGKACLPDKTIDCPATKQCPVDCVGKYDESKSCPSDCGLSASTITQRYIVTTPAKHGGTPCLPDKTIDCPATKQCPVDCKGEYEAPPICPSGCGLSASTITQRYIVTTPAKHGGTPCLPDITIDCPATNPCPTSSSSTFFSPSPTPSSTPSPTPSSTPSSAPSSTPSSAPSSTPPPPKTDDSDVITIPSYLLIGTSVLITIMFIVFSLRR
jgi:uncharacterized protein (DUF433 family)